MRKHSLFLLAVIGFAGLGLANVKAGSVVVVGAHNQLAREYGAPSGGRNSGHSQTLVKSTAQTSEFSRRVM